MSAKNGDLLTLLGLLEGVTSAADGARLRERLAEEPELRSRMQKLRAVAAAMSESNAAADPLGRPRFGLSEESIAAFVDGDLSKRAASEVETALWESDDLLAEAISTYRFVRMPVELPATRSESTSRLLDLFPAAEQEGTVDTVATDSDLLAPSLPPLETPSVEPSTLETASPDQTTYERELPPLDRPERPDGPRQPPVVTRSRRDSTRPSADRNRRTAIIVFACGVALIALLTVVGWWWPRNPTSPPPIANEGDPPTDLDESGSGRAIVDREPGNEEREAPVPRDDAFVVVPQSIVGAVFTRRGDSWAPLGERMTVDEAESFVVPDNSWTAFEFAGSNFILAGPTELVLNAPTPSDGHVQLNLVHGRLIVDVPSGGTPVRLELAPPDDDVEPQGKMVTEGRDVSIVVTSLDDRQELTVLAGTVVLDEQRLEASQTVARSATGAWSMTEPGSDASWRNPPTADPATRLLANRLRGSEDVVASLLAATGAASRLAARWALELDERRTIETLVARAVEDRDDALLFAVASQSAESPSTQRLWREVGDRIGNPRLGEQLAAWHALATSRTPLDGTQVRGLIRGLSHEHVLVRSAAIHTLRAKTGAALPFDPRGTAAERRRAIEVMSAELPRLLRRRTPTPPRSRPKRGSR